MGFRVYIFGGAAMKPLKCIDKNMKLKYNNEIQPCGLVDTFANFPSYFFIAWNNTQGSI